MWHETFDFDRPDQLVLTILEEGQRAQRYSLLRAILAMHPGDANAAFSLAGLLQTEGRTKEAASEIFIWWNHVIPSIDTTLRAVDFLFECDSWKTARRIVDAAILWWPDDPAFCERRGEMALRSAQRRKARACFERAIELSPRQFEAWLGLSQCQRYTDRSHPDIARYQAAATDSETDSGTRITAPFALAKAYDDLGDFKSANNALRHGNAIVFKQRSWNSTEWSSLIARRLVEDIPPTVNPSDFRPVFLLGMPGSCRIFISKLLESGGQFRDWGKTDLFASLYHMLLDTKGLNDPAALRKCALFIERRMRGDEQPVSYYIDRSSFSFLYVDLLHALFPGASFIHCCRNGRDMALYNWSHYFSQSTMNFAYSLDGIQVVLRDYRTMMEHWKKKLDLQLFEVDYEFVVRRPEHYLVGLRNFVGAETDEVFLKSRDSLAEIAPLQSDDSFRVDRWRRYLPFLPELLDFD